MSSLGIIGMWDNPYNDDDIVKEHTMFFGRTDTLSQVYTACNKRQSVFLLGTRKSGKSTILKYLQAPEMQQKLNLHASLKQQIFIYMDMEEYLGDTAEDFFRKAGQHILRQTPSGIPLQVAANQATTNHISRLNNQYHFTMILKQLHVQYHAILLMDRFETFVSEMRFSPLFFSVLRSYATRGWVSYVIASTKLLHHIVPELADSPFADGFLRIPVGPLEEKDAEALITVPPTRSGQSFHPDEVAWISKQAGRQPFFLQRVCHHFYKHKEQNNGKIVNTGEIWKDSYNDLKPYFQLIWQNLSLDEQRQFYQDKEQSARVQRRMPELSESDLFCWYISDEHKKR
jgi:hypothetical protein